MVIEEIRVLIRLADGEAKPTIDEFDWLPPEVKSAGEPEQHGNAPDDRILEYRFVKQ